jgi:hypothetical protein
MSFVSEDLVATVCHHARLQTSLLSSLQDKLPDTPNQALERTADWREDSLSMTPTAKSEAKLALVSGRSACSR